MGGAIWLSVGAWLTCVTTTLNVCENRLTLAPPVTLADARRSLELATALYSSAATGAAVTMPIQSDHPSYYGWRAQR